MENKVFPTKGNLIASKKSLALARMGYDLLDRKRNVLIREMMQLVDKVKMLRDEITQSYATAYYLDRHHLRYRRECACRNRRACHLPLGHGRRGAVRQHRTVGNENGVWL